MRAKSRHDPRRFDIADAAAHEVQLAGRWPLAELPRLAADHPADAGVLAGDVAWSARAEHRAATGAAQTWLHLVAQAEVQRTCQRCLQPMTLPLAVTRALRFVAGEDAAAALDADSEDDVLALEPRLDLRELVEDELLLALPLVPRHQDCPQPLPRGDDGVGDDAEPTQHAFAALAALKPGGTPH